MQTIFNTDI